MTKYIELPDWCYDEILEMLKKVVKFEERQYDAGMENRYKEAKQTLDEFINSNQYNGGQK